MIVKYDFCCRDEKNKTNRIINQRCDLELVGIWHHLNEFFISICLLMRILCTYCISKAATSIAPIEFFFLFIHIIYYRYNWIHTETPSHFFRFLSTFRTRDYWFLFNSFQLEIIFVYQKKKQNKIYFWNYNFLQIQNSLLFFQCFYCTLWTHTRLRRYTQNTIRRRN